VYRKAISSRFLLTCVAIFGLSRVGATSVLPPKATTLSEKSRYYSFIRDIFQIIRLCKGVPSIAEIDGRKQFYKCSNGKLVKNLSFFLRVNKKKEDFFFSKLKYMKETNGLLEIAIVLDDIPVLEIIDVKRIVRGQHHETHFSSIYCGGPKVSYCYKDLVDYSSESRYFKKGCGLNGFESVFAIENFCSSYEGSKVSMFCSTEIYKNVFVNNKIKKKILSEKKENTKYCIKYKKY